MLYKKFFGYALSVALIYNHQRNDAIEVVDDSFVKVFSEIGKFDTSQSFKGWLRKIVINTSIDRLRKNHRKHIFMETGTYHVPDETSNIISDLTAQEIIGLLNRLPDILKIVFSLYEVEGYSHKEIAEQLNIPVSSSRVYLTRAKRKLRELFPAYFKLNQKRKYGN